MGTLHQGAMVRDITGAGRVLQQQAEITIEAFLHQLRLLTDDHFNAQRLGTSAQHVKGLRVAVARDEKRRGLVFGQALAEGHGLGGSGGFIE